MNEHANGDVMTDPIIPFDRAGIEERQKERSNARLFTGENPNVVWVWREAEADLRAALQELDRRAELFEWYPKRCNWYQGEVDRLKTEVVVLRQARDSLQLEIQASESTRGAGNRDLLERLAECQGGAVVPIRERVELGCPGHLIIAKHCHWRRHTQGGGFRVSTVGDYYYMNRRQALGAGPANYFETMVFRTTGEVEPENDGCGCEHVADWSEVDGCLYATAGDAQAGHEAFVAQYIGAPAAPGADQEGR